MDQTDDWEIDETEEAPSEEASPPLKFEIMNYPADTTLQGYLDMWNKDQLVVPEFQRDYVWDQVKASKLIESFLLGLPVPGVFLFKQRNAANYLIIDGQQRITSIVFYLRGFFGDRRFRLKNVDKKWDGKAFEDLSEEDKFRLSGTVLRSIIIQQVSPDDDTSIYHIFERLNTGGVNLNPMEIRQCVAHSPFISFLKQVNSDKNWRLILGKDKEDKRLRDVELVLRCIALSRDLEAYEKPMKGFLNTYAEKEKRTPSDHADLAARFKWACSEIIKSLGEKPFHHRGRLNYGLLDSVMVPLLQGKVGSIDAARFKGLVEDRDFLALISANTSDSQVLKKRIAMSEKYL